MSQSRMGFIERLHSMFPGSVGLTDRVWEVPTS
jgi:hypothetical protein